MKVRKQILEMIRVISPEQWKILIDGVRRKDD